MSSSCGPRIVRGVSVQERHFLHLVLDRLDCGDVSPEARTDGARDGNAERRETEVVLALLRRNLKTQAPRWWELLKKGCFIFSEVHSAVQALVSTPSSCIVRTSRRCVRLAYLDTMCGGIKYR
jgi:hypothetical protein